MEYLLLFTAGLLSSMHCIGMCGCFVSAYSINLKGSKSKKAVSHLLYSLGRLTTYSFIGAVMGLIGSSLYVLGRIAGIQMWITVIAGVMMIYLGLTLSGILPKVAFLDRSGAVFIKYSRGIFSKLIKKQGVFFTYPLGVVLGFLPCCLLYTIQLQAMSTGSPLKGALSMFFFGLGTVPSLFSFGMLFDVIGNKTRQKLMKYASVVIIILGANSIYRALFS